MRQLVESLRRLYLLGKITKEKVWQLKEEGKITSEEYNFIIE